MKFTELFKKKIKVATHNGSFHADEVFAIATLSIWAKKKGYRIEITRTRNEEILNKSDIIVDVGGIDDPEKKKFDHHQKEGAGTHQNGVPYASFGLIWKHYAKEICNNKVAEDIENRLVVPIDARDNGINITKVLREDVPEYTVVRELIVAFRATWKDNESYRNRKFFELLDIAKKIIENEIRRSEIIKEGESLVLEAIKDQDEPEILILEEYFPWENSVVKFNKIKCIVYPDYEKDKWCIEFARDSLGDYNSNRGSFPENWRGLRDKELQEACGNEDAIFCHRGGFFAVAKTKESALEMARKALN